MNKKIAIPTDVLGKLDAHFGHCKFFTVYTVNDKEITQEEKLVPPPHEPGVIPKWLSEKGATDLVAGGVGQKAIEIFNKGGVNVFVGAPQLPVKEILDGFLNGTIEFKGNYCDH